MDRHPEIADGGRRIVLATDRPVGILELQSGGETLNYRFTLIELRLGPEGKGDGETGSNGDADPTRS